MTLAIAIESAPLEVGSDGVARVSNTRVTLDTVVIAFLEGATAEEIREQYTSLRLSDIYFVIGYYLKHKPEVDAYLLERQTQAVAIRREVEQQFNPLEIRERLIARRGFGEGGKIYSGLIGKGIE
jgi:uncharacterized protein (DUF433 family)